MMARETMVVLAMCATLGFPTTTSAFTAIPALNLPALHPTKRAFTPTLRQFRSALGDSSPEAPVGSTRRQFLQQGVAAIGGIALTMSSSADAEELKGYKLVEIFRVRPSVFNILSSFRLFYYSAESSLGWVI
jgi:hypothetical protein